MSRSLFGSVREKLSRKSAIHSTKSPTSTAPSTNPFADPVRQPNGPADAPPPAYSPIAPSAGLNFANITSDDDQYAFLSTFDTIFVIDDSGSMAGNSWREVADALSAIAPICTSHDKDGIDLYFLNHRSSVSATAARPAGGYHNITSADTVENIFRSVVPRSTTPTGARLQSILKPYVLGLSQAKDMDNVKPVNIIVITDGRPTDDPESVIVQQAKKLDQIEAPPYQVGIQFFQVGNDRAAREALRELDDDLADLGIRDMVDAATWDVDESRSRKLTADGILKVVLGAVVRRLDRKVNATGPQSRR